MSPPRRRPTSADVAARAGVSRATVSMVMNGRVEGTVAESTRDRVLAAAQELGYARSAIALSLREQRTRTIGLITDEISTSPWAGRMVRAASARAAAAGYLTITVDLSLRGSDMGDAVRALAERQVDGLVVATMGSSIVPIPTVHPGLPMVLLNCRPEAEDPAGEVPSFVPDDRAGARRATERLLDVGHRRVVMLSGDDPALATRERERGYREAMEAAGLAPRIVPAGWQMSDGSREAGILLESGAAERPTALFCIRDRVAAGALHAAASRGVPVPEELSVIGFDDEDFFAEELTPGLTTIALPHEAMGERAMSALLARIEGTEEAAGGAGTVPCALVERGTVGAPPVDCG